MDKSFKYVPVDPSKETIYAAQQAAINETNVAVDTYTICVLWDAMLAASPEQPSPAESDKEAVRNAALEEAVDACLKVVASKDAERFMGKSAHYAACAGAIETLKSQPAQPIDSRTEFSDTEMLDWMIKSECAVISLGHGEYDIYSTDPDEGGQLLINQPSARDATKSAMRAEREGS